jgi:chemotaxis-related protein WspB
VKQAAALFLVFRIGSERYALRATEVARCCRACPQADCPRAAWVAGVFAHRGAVVPVIDSAP